MRRFWMLALCAALAAGGPALAEPRPGGGLANAKAYVDWIYRSIRGDRFDFRQVRFTLELRQWMDRDARYSASKGEVGALDGIPFCDCQDFDPNYRFETQIVRTATGASARVRLRNGQWSQVTVDLVPSHRGWLVSDVHTKTMPSLLAYLRQEVPREEKGE